MEAERVTVAQPTLKRKASEHERGEGDELTETKRMKYGLKTCLVVEDEETATALEDGDDVHRQHARELALIAWDVEQAWDELDDACVASEEAWLQTWIKPEYQAEARVIMDNDDIWNVSGRAEWAINHGLSEPSSLRPFKNTPRLDKFFKQQQNQASPLPQLMERDLVSPIRDDELFPALRKVRDQLSEQQRDLVAAAHWYFRVAARTGLSCELKPRPTSTQEAIVYLLVTGSKPGVAQHPDMFVRLVSVVCDHALQGKLLDWLADLDVLVLNTRLTVVFLHGCGNEVGVRVEGSLDGPYLADADDDNTHDVVLGYEQEAAQSCGARKCWACQGKEPPELVELSYLPRKVLCVQLSSPTTVVSPVVYRGWDAYELLCQVSARVYYYCASPGTEWGPGMDEEEEEEEDVDDDDDEVEL